MKKSERIGAIIQRLSDSPNQLFSLNEFCRSFNAAKSSISEDIKEAAKISSFNGIGIIETIHGAAGGVRFVPSVSDSICLASQNKLCDLLKDPSRMLGGGFLYTSDIMFNPGTVREMGYIFASVFKNCGADYVVTIETKGIPLAVMTAHLLNIPVVVVRRETKISEGPTVSINYFSGSYDRIQKMSVSKRAATSGKRALIIDDFMRAGGSLKGISEILSEFDTEIVGIGVAIASTAPKSKKVSGYTPLVLLENVDEVTGKIEVFPNKSVFLKNPCKHY